MTDQPATLAAAIAAAGITIAAEFVPFKNTEEGKGKTQPSISSLKLNWRVTLLKDGLPIIVTPYMAGVAHCPSYRQGSKTVADQERLLKECNTGRSAVGFAKRIDPDICDVVSCLLADASVLDCASFEDWASDCGYDTDSRKAEAIYRACLKTALKLRAALGDAGLQALRDAAQDY